MMASVEGGHFSVGRYAAGIGWVIGYLVLWLAIVIVSQLLGQAVGHNLAKTLGAIVQGIVEIAGVLALTWAFLAKGNKANLPSLGMVGPRWHWLVIGLVAGALGIFAICAVEYALGWLHPLPVQLGPYGGTSRIIYTLAWFFPSIGTGFVEELAFRGYVFQTLANRGSIWIAALASSFLWAATHMTVGGFGIGFIATITALGIIFVIFRVFSGSLWLPMGFHAAWDFSQFNVVGLATTGLGNRDPSIFPVSQTGPAIWVGSPPSIEGGMLYLGLMLLILMGLMVFMRPGRSGRSESRAGR